MIPRSANHPPPTEEQVTPFEAGAKNVVERSFTLLDTAVASTNIGDEIIMEAVRDELSALRSKMRNHSVASHEWMSRYSRSVLQMSDFAIAGGTNLLSSRMWFRCPWKLKLIDGLLCRNVVLMGTGWYQFQRRPDPYSRWLLRKGNTMRKAEV